MIAGPSGEARLREKLRKIEALFAGAATAGEKPQLMPLPTGFALVSGMPPLARIQRKSNSRSRTAGRVNFSPRYVAGMGSGRFDIAGCTGKPLSSKHHGALSIRSYGQSFGS
jgi:hypothetical protein